MLLPPLPGAGAAWQDPSKGGVCVPESTCRAGGPLPPQRLASLIEIGEERGCLQGARCSSIWLGATAGPEPPPSEGSGDAHPFRGQVTLPCSARERPRPGPSYVQGCCSAPKGSVAQPPWPLPSPSAAGPLQGSAMGQAQSKGSSKGRN